MSGSASESASGSKNFNQSGPGPGPKKFNKPVPGPGPKKMDPTGSNAESKSNSFYLLTDMPAC